MSNSPAPNLKKLNQKVFFPLLLLIFLISLGGFLIGAIFENEERLYIQLSETEFTLTVGDSTLITFEASNQLGSFIYSSNDTSVVRFIENRLIAVSPGNGTITVSSQSNPSIFQTVSVIVKERVIEPEPEVPVELEVPEPVEPEPELPVVEDPEDEPVVDTPIEYEEDENVVTPPSIFNITITNETGAVITTLEVEEGSFITTSSLELPDNFKGFFFEGETCTDDPFDLETPINENLTLIQASFNDQAPCIQLDYIVLNGRPVAGSTLSVDVFPVGANVTISWYTSVNNRTYREIPGESGSTFTVRPEDSGKFIRVYVVSDSNPPVVRFDTIKLDVFGTVSATDVNDISQPDPAIQQAILDGFIPISNKQELSYITTTSSVTFGSGTFYELVTEGGLHKNYILVNDVTLSGVTYNTSFIQGTFTGTFDGNGFELSDLTIKNGTGDIGLFNKLNGALITNLNINNFDISGQQRIGGIVGLIENAEETRFINVHVTNSTVGASSFMVGGFIGRIRDSLVIVSQSSFSGTVKSAGSQSGGLVGNIAHEDSSTTNKVAAQLEIYNVQIFGTVEGSSNIGGLIGTVERGQFSKFKNIIDINQVSNYALITGSANYIGGFVGIASSVDLSIQQSENQGNVFGINFYIGGFIGGAGTTLGSPTQSSIIILNSLNTAEIKGNGGDVGGIIGFIANDDVFTEMREVYSSGIITGSGSDQGGIIGDLRGSITFSGVVYLESSSNLSIGAINSNPIINGSPLALNSISMQAISTFADLGWDIGQYPNQHEDKIWAMGYEHNLLTFPWLTHTEAPNQVQKGFLNAQINFGFIPLSSPQDILNINSTSSVTFAAGTIYETTVSGGLDKKYMLVNDIDLTSLTGYLQIIQGNFNGFLEGNGFTLSNLTLNDNSQDGLGLFEFIGNATIQNLTLSRFHISGKDYLGTLASGVDGNAIVHNVVVTGSTIQGRNIVGGLFGELLYQQTLDLRNINISALVSGLFDVGGVIGLVDGANGTLSRIHVLNQVNGFDSVGGFIGLATDSALNIQSSSNVSTINGENNVGGIIGQTYATTLTMSAVYNTGQIVRTPDQIGVNAGGLIGLIASSNGRTQHLSDVYSLGDVIADQNAGGLIGQINDGSLTLVNSYAFPTNFSYSNITGAIIGFVQQSSLTFSGVIYPNTNSVSVGSILTSSLSGQPSALPIESMLAVNTFINAGWNITSSYLNATTWAIGFEGGTTLPYLSFQKAPINLQKITLSSQLISSREDLENITVTGSYILTSDISLAGQDWTPIANFSGTLDGNGFTISNGIINRSGTNEVGFFKRISGASISHLTFDNFNVTGGNNTGLIVGLIDSASVNTMTSITLTNSSINGGGSVGGFIGRNLGNKLNLIRLINYADVSSSGSWVGGLVGISTNELLIEQSLNYGNIRGGSQYTGGLIGRLWSNTNARLIEIGNFGLVSSVGSGAGGLVGGSAGTTNQLIIEDSFNLGIVEITGSSNANSGGIIGYILDTTVTLSAIYSAGNVTTAGTNAGLIFGRFSNFSLSTQNAIFSLNNLDAQVDGYLDTLDRVPTNIYSTKISPSQMSTLSTFSNAGWDIASHSNSNNLSSVWIIKESETIPWLRWIGEPDNSQLSP